MARKANSRALIGLLVGVGVGVALYAGTGNVGVGIGVGAGLAIIFGGGVVVLGHKKSSG